MDDLPLFRASKKRRLARHRDDQSAEGSHTADDVQSAPGRDDTTVDDGVDVANILKLRKQNRSRGVGVQFSQQRPKDADSNEVNETMALTVVDPDEEKLRHIFNRFIGSTGQAVDVDKHMMAYVDTEMAKLDNLAVQESSIETLSEGLDSRNEALLPGQKKTTSSHLSRPQITEFDLGEDVHQTNLARTEAAIARAQSGLPLPIEESKPQKPRKPRLGRDGKPFRPRPRKRRNSEDVARDALVEQMLHEHKVDVYEDEQDTGPVEAGDDENADERLAEQFRQQFLDAAAARRQKHRAKSAVAAKAKGMGPEQSGPKLGGGRSARIKMAQMHQQQRATQAQK